MQVICGLAPDLQYQSRPAKLAVKRTHEGPIWQLGALTGLLAAHRSRRALPNEARFQLSS